MGAILERGPSIRRHILMVMVFGVPLVFLWQVTFDPFNVPKLALVAICVVLAGGVRLLEIAGGAPTVGLRPLLWPALFIAGPLVLSWSFSPYRGWALLGQHGRFEGLLPYLLVIAAGILLADAFRGFAMRLAWGFTASATLVSAYAIIQGLNLDPLGLPVHPYIHATVGHGNFVGGLLAIALPIALTLWLRDVRGKRWAALCTALIVVGLLLSMSQGAWAAGLAGAGLTVGLALKDRVKHAGRLGALVALASALAVVSVVLLAAVDPYNRVVGGTTRARAEWAKAAVKMGADSPFIGHGPNVYALRSPSYRTALDALSHGNLLSDGPHSVPLSAFANSGILGFAGFAAVFIWVFRRARRQMDPPIAGAFLAGIAAYGVQALVSFDQFLLAFAFWVCLAGFAAAAPPGEQTLPDRSRSIPRMLLGAAAIPLVVAGMLFAVAILRADYRAQKGLEAFGRSRSDEGQASFRSAIALVDQAEYRLALGRHLAFVSAEPGENNALQELHTVLQPLTEMPYLPAVMREGLAFHGRGGTDSAAERAALSFFELAVVLDPYNPNLRVWLAEAHANLGDPREAFERLEIMVPVMRDHPRARDFTAPVWAVLAMTADRIGNTSAATEYLRSAIAESTVQGRDVANCHVLLARKVVGGDDSDFIEQGISLTCPQVSRAAFES